MTWVIIPNDPEDEPQTEPDEDGDIAPYYPVRTISLDGGYPHYRLEVSPEFSDHWSWFMKLWVRWRPDQEWRESQNIGPAMLTHFIAVFLEAQESDWGYECFPKVKLTSVFEGQAVFDPNEVHWAPEGTELDFGRDLPPFWTDGFVPHIENLRGVAELAIDNGISLGSYRESSPGEPPRLVRLADDDWNHGPYMSACRHIGEERRYMVSEAEVQFRQRCEPWFNRDRITEVILAVIRGQPTPA